MWYQTLPPFNPVANGVRSTVQVPTLAATLGRVVLQIPTVPANSITKATISEIVVKIGNRVVFGPISGTELDKLNKYRGIYDSAEHLTIDFTERDGLSRVTKEIGGIDLPALGARDVFVEVVNTAGAGNPFLSAIAGMTALQVRPQRGGAAANPRQQARAAQREQYMHKVLKYVVPSNGGTLQTWMPDFRGAVVKRIAFMYAGADWTATADGNLRQVLVRKNGIAIHDNVRCLFNRVVQQEQRKVPQSRMYMVDFTADNVYEAALETRDARSLQFDLTLTANDTVTAFAEVLDVPNNL